MEHRLNHLVCYISPHTLCNTGGGRVAAPWGGEGAAGKTAEDAVQGPPEGCFLLSARDPASPHSAMGTVAGVGSMGAREDGSCTWVVMVPSLGALGRDFSPSWPTGVSPRAPTSTRWLEEEGFTALPAPRMAEAGPQYLRCCGAGRGWQLGVSSMGSSTAGRLHHPGSSFVVVPANFNFFLGLRFLA